MDVALTAGGVLADIVEHVCAAQSPDEALTTLFDWITETLVEAPDRPGCPVAAVTLAADDPDGRLRAAGAEIFGRLRVAVGDCLRRDGVPDTLATTAAALAVSAAEGAIILCRADRGREPIDQVRTALLLQLPLLPRSGSPAPTPTATGGTGPNRAGSGPNRADPVT